MFGLFQKKSTIESRILDAIDNGSLSGSSSIRITPNDALGVMAVFAAVRVISEDVAKLPAKLKRQTENGKETAISEPEHIILSRIGKPPSENDDGYTAMEWIESVVASAALGGVGVVYFNKVNGKAREAVPIKRDFWRVENGQWYIKWANQSWEKVSRSNLMVLRGPQLGLDVTQSARQAIDLARRLDTMMTSIAKKAGRPNGIISTESLNSIEKAKKFVERITNYFGPSGDGGLMPVDLGALNYIRLSLTPEELQHNETYSRVVSQIASAYRVQPSHLMHALTESNNASLYSSNRQHVEVCIQPWTKRFCQTFDKDVLGQTRVSDGYYCDIALQGLLQGDPDSRSNLYMTLRTVGAMSPLTVAKMEDLPTTNVSDDPSFPLLTNPNPSQIEDPKDDN